MDLKDKIKEIKKCYKFESAAALLSEIDLKQFSSRHFTSLGRYFEQMNETPDIKIAYLSNFVVDMLPAYVNVYAAHEKIHSSAYIGAYDQYFQEILLEDSPLLKYEPDMVLLCLAMVQLEPEVHYGFTALTTKRKYELLDKILGAFEKWIHLAQEKLNASVLLSNFALPGYTQSGIADESNSPGEMGFYYELNTRLVKMASGNPRVHVLDLAKLSARFGFNNAYDPKIYYMAKIIWSEGFQSMVAQEIVRYIIGIKGMTRKCLVLDLDNTLWGGVLGEEGPLGVKIGQGDPVSEAYLDFQYRLRSLKDRGIMLAICSKNNPEDVLEVFEKRPEMPLKIDDFVAIRINWNHKHINIQKLSEELNIGTDSMVFMDDSPAECSLIRQMLPGVKTLLVPPKPELMPALVENLVDFEKIIILKEDMKKTEQYQQNRRRKELKEGADDLESYLHSLGTEIYIRHPAKEDIDRVHQLSTKTNQFNVTTIRYSVSDIYHQINDDAYDIFIVSARDTFSDLGIIGLCLVEHAEDSARIDSFILSCRAMGRGIESAIMNYLKNRYFKDKGIRLLKASYVPTPKNKPVREFFDQQGFAILEFNEQGEKTYQLLYDNWSEVECSWIKVVGD
jgi:FkbH-like protein